MTGFTDSWGAGNSDLWLLELGPEGQPLWSKTWGGQGFEYGWAVDVAWDGTITVAGDTTSFGSGSFDAWILRVEPTGTIEGCEVSAAQQIVRKKTRATGGGGFFAPWYPGVQRRWIPSTVEKLAVQGGMVCQD